MDTLTRWTSGQRVEAYHPSHRREWGMATVESQHDAYVTVRFDDDEHPLTTYHLNVREPGTPDPVSLR